MHTRKMAKVLSFQTIPPLYWKNDKGVKPANGFQPAFSGHSVMMSTNMMSRMNGSKTQNTLEW